MPLKARGGGELGGSCSCPLEEHHQGKELLNTVIPLSVDTTYNLLAMQDQFMIDVYNIRKTYGENSG